MFAEIDKFFTSRDIQIEITIYEIREAFNSMTVEYFTPYPEVSEIIENYMSLSRDVFLK
jgi:hypothetical protein